MSGLTGNNILGGSSGQGDTGYDIDQSLRFDGSGYLNRTPSSSSNRKTWTWSSWVKRGNLGDSYKIFQQRENSNASQQFGLQFRSDDQLRILDQNGSGSTVMLKQTTQVFRDPSAWYHIVVAIDITESAVADKAKIWVNGEAISDWSTETNYANNTTYNTSVNNTVRLLIGASRPNSSGTLNNYLDGCLAEVHFIDGQALTPASFGETNEDTNQWQAIEYDGSYGTNGFYLKFQDSSALGDDSSGNTNDFTVTNLVATDQVLDSPTNNFATLNSVFVSASGSGRESTLSEGNLKATTPTSGSGYNGPAMGTIGMTSGKWYFEWYIGSSNWPAVGIAKADYNAGYAQPNVGNRVWLNGGSLYGVSSSSSGVTYTTGDIVGCAVDMDNGKMWFSKNGTFISSGDPAAGTNAQFTDLLSASDMGSTGQVLPFFSDVNWGSSDTVTFNAGQDSSFAGAKTAQGNGGVGEDFYYTPPTGYKALNTNNLDDPSIDDPTVHMNTVLYSGSTGVDQSITGVGFQPDFVWLKNRGATTDYGLFDSVRGIRASIYSNLTAAEQTGTGTQDMYSFNSDGFSVGSNQYVECNTTGYNYVGWNWKAGGTAVSNTDGTITSSVSANTTAGFTIVSYTGNGASGATIGHGLSAKPELVFKKNRSQSTNFVVTTTLIDGSNDYAFLNLTDAFGSSAEGVPTSSVIRLYPNAENNSSGDNFICYAFHSVEGYSRVGSYTGNGNVDGTFIYTGFRPAFLLLKRYDSTGNWILYDNKRDEYNPEDEALFPDLTAAETTQGNGMIDFNSNGFKLRNTGSVINPSSGTCIYLAFAESPFKTSNAR